MLMTKQIAKRVSIQGPKLLCGLIPLFFLILTVSPVSFAGVNALPHLGNGAGARSIGMGGAFTAVANDATATVWNPAGLGSAADVNLNFSTQQLDLDRSHNFIALTKSLGEAGAIGLALTSYGVSDIPQYDTSERYGGTIDYSTNAYSLSYGVGLGNFNLGLTGRLVSDNFGTDSVENQSGFGGVDIGLIGHALPVDNRGEEVSTFHYGLAVKHLGGSLGDDNVPVVLRVGAAYDLWMGNVVTFAVDVEQEYVNLENSPVRLRAGAEYRIVTYRSTELSLRGGISASRDAQTLSGGFGVNIGGLQIDYAIQDGRAIELQGVGSTHFASVSYRF